MAWVESHQALRNHRKTLRVAAALQVDRHKLIGHLMCLWWWALDNVDADGSLQGITNAAIAGGAEWPLEDADRFVRALTASGFIDRSGRKRTLHNWHQYAGRYQDQRAANAERMRRRRADRADARAPHVDDTTAARAGATVPNLTSTPYPPGGPPSPEPSRLELAVDRARAPHIGTPGQHSAMANFAAQLGEDAVLGALQRALERREPDAYGTAFNELKALASEQRNGHRPRSVLERPAGSIASALARRNQRREAEA